MFKGINKVLILGVLGINPEIKYIMNGREVVNLSIATSEIWKDKNTGEYCNRTEWHKVVLYDKLCRVAIKYFKKGSKIYVEGILRTKKWRDENNSVRSSTEIVANSINVFDFKDKPESSTLVNNEQKSEVDEKYKENVFEKDVPF